MQMISLFNDIYREFEWGLKEIFFFSSKYKTKSFLVIRDNIVKIP